MQMSKFRTPKHLWLAPELIAEVRNESVVDGVTKEENALPCRLLVSSLQHARKKFKLEHYHKQADSSVQQDYLQMLTEIVLQLAMMIVQLPCVGVIRSWCPVTGLRPKVTSLGAYRSPSHLYLGANPTLPALQ